MSKLQSRFLLGLKGVAMGAADVIPGVSGGTIAFITGIYEELLSTISSLNLSSFKTWKSEGFRSFWKTINGGFLFTLLGGIFISIVTLSFAIGYLLDNFPIQLWSFFFGLVMSSVLLVGKQVGKWSVFNILALVAGTLIAYFITIANPSSGIDSLWYIFICGCLAICAMILPGISGSFILLLLGAYSTVIGSISGFVEALREIQIDAIKENGIRLLVFAVGCVIGLASFSRLLNWMFKKAHDITIAVLTGFLIGSLNKLWPWKETLAWFTKHEGMPNEEQVALVQENISPMQFSELYTMPNHLIASIIFCVLGFVLIAVLDRFSPKHTK